VTFRTIGGVGSFLSGSDFDVSFEGGKGVLVLLLLSGVVVSSSDIVERPKSEI
jgi:hypothetical protein